jgi:4'-phosphopantetheinyl transferase
LHVLNKAIEVVVLALDARSDSASANEAALSAAERERAARFRADVDRRRYVAGRCMLRRLLAARCGLPPEALEIRCGEHGKPVLADGSLHFSVSHSGELVAYAFARASAVGIDIEAVRPLAASCVIAKRTFPAREWRAYAALPEAERLPGFYRGWTRTEALAKALGGGLALPRENLDGALHHGWAVDSFAPAPGLAGAIAYRDRQCP